MSKPLFLLAAAAAVEQGCTGEEVLAEDLRQVRELDDRACLRPHEMEAVARGGELDRQRMEHRERCVGCFVMSMNRDDELHSVEEDLDALLKKLDDPKFNPWEGVESEDEKAP